jgi:hypothetical protein
MACFDALDPVEPSSPESGGTPAEPLPKRVRLEDLLTMVEEAPESSGMAHACASSAPPILSRGHGRRSSPTSPRRPQAPPSALGTPPLARLRASPALSAHVAGPRVG